MPLNPVELKCQQLLALATNDGASPEESRTAAILLCRLIQKNRLIICATRVEVPPPEPKSKTKWVKLKSKYSGWCKICRNNFTEGEFVYWAKGEGARHVACYKAQ